jgi:hypothetical protein
MRLGLRNTLKKSDLLRFKPVLLCLEFSSSERFCNLFIIFYKSA